MPRRNHKGDCLKDPVSFIDLFAGAGGFSLGLHKAGLKGVLAIERDPMAFSTLEYNLIERANGFEWPDWFPKQSIDIREAMLKYADQMNKLRGDIDLVVGAPPCQGFSTAVKRVRQDERNMLFKEFAKFVNIVRPKIVLFENVPGFSYKFQDSGEYFRTYYSKLDSELRKIGYSGIKSEIFDFSKFGVPQSRKRLIICSTDRDVDPDSVLDLIRERGSKEPVGLSEAISDLRRANGLIESPDSHNFTAGLYGEPASSYQIEMRKSVTLNIPDSHRFARHRHEIEMRFQAILSKADRNKNINESLRPILGLNRKRNIIPLSPESPSPTLTTLPDDYIHYEEPRILTVREYARIQSFPDYYQFKGKYTTGGKLRAKEVPRYSQVANAVPPKFSSEVGNVVKKILR